MQKNYFVKYMLRIKFQLERRGLTICRMKARIHFHKSLFQVIMSSIDMFLNFAQKYVLSSKHL